MAFIAKSHSAFLPFAHPLLFCYYIACLFCSFPYACNCSFTNRFHSVPMEFFNFPCLQAPNHWLHCYRKEWIPRPLYRTGFTLPWLKKRRIVAELKGCSWQVFASQTANRLIIASSLLASLPLTLNISRNPGSFLTRIIKLGEQHNIFYKQRRKTNQTNKKCWGFCLVLPHAYIWPWCVRCFHIRFLFAFNNCWDAHSLISEWSA